MNISAWHWLKLILFPSIKVFSSSFILACFPSKIHLVSILFFIFFPACCINVKEEMQYFNQIGREKKVSIQAVEMKAAKCLFIHFFKCTCWKHICVKNFSGNLRYFFVCGMYLGRHMNIYLQSASMIFFCTRNRQEFLVWKYFEIQI